MAGELLWYRLELHRECWIHPVHGELPICTHFLHFLESLLGRCLARFGKSEKGPKIGLGCPSVHTLEHRTAKLFKSEIREHSYGTSLYRLPTSEFATVINGHGPEPERSKTGVVNPKRELFNGLRREMDSSSSFVNFNPLNADRVLANHKYRDCPGTRAASCDPTYCRPLPRTPTENRRS